MVIPWAWLAPCWELREEVMRTVFVTKASHAEEPRELTGLREKGRLGRRAEVPQAASRRAFWRRWHLKPAVMGLPLLLLCFWTLEPSL